MPRPVLLLALASALAAPLAAQSWPEWTLECNSAAGVPGAHDWPYTLLPPDTSPASFCLWEHDDGDLVEISRAAANELLLDLGGASRALRDARFRPPAFAASPGGRWVAVLFPAGGRPCLRDACDASDVAAQTGRVRTGPTRTFTVRSDYAPGDAAPVYELMRGVQAAYGLAPGLSLEDPTGDCRPGCWVSVGTAAGFADWYLATSRGRRASLPPRFDRSLATGSNTSDYPDGLMTAPFWHAAAGAMGGVGYLRSIYGSAGAGTHVLDAVYTAPLADGMGAWDFPAQYRRFVDGWLTGPHAFLAPQPTLRAPVGETARHRVSNQPPLSTAHVPVRIVGLDGLASVTVGLEGASPHTALHVMTPRTGAAAVPAELGRATYETDTSVLCEDDGPVCELWVNVSNVARRPDENGPASYALTVDVRPMAAACDFRLPEGVTGLHYAIDGPGTRARLRLDVPPGPGRRPLSGPIDATFDRWDAQSQTWRSTSSRVTLACTPTGIDVTSLTDALVGVGPQRAEAEVDASPMVLPARPEPGLELPDVTTRLAMSVDGTEALRATARVHHRHVVGRTTLTLGEDPRLADLPVWLIRGLASSTMALDSRALEDQMEQAGADLSGRTGERVRAGIRGLFGRLNAGMESGPSAPHRVWYSLDYGLVRTEADGGVENGGTTVRLFRTYPAAE